MNQETTPTRTLLESRRKAILAELPQALRDELAEIDLALKAMGPTHAVVGEWAKYRKAIDAVEAYLTKRDERVNRFEIARDLKEGGFAQDANRPGINVLDTIRYHSTESGRLTCDKNDMVGLPSWKKVR